MGQDIVVALCGQASGFENVYDFVKNDEKQKVKRSHLKLGRGELLVLISESGLYKVLPESNKPETMSLSVIKIGRAHV